MRLRRVRLRLLFETGACVSSPTDLGHFCTVVLAAAFEIAPSEPIAPQHAPDEASDEAVADSTSSAAGDLLGDLGPTTSASAQSEPRPPTRTRDDSLALRAAGDPPPISSRPRRALTKARLSTELARHVHGQEPALERVASIAVAQLTKRHPSRPGSVALFGQPGVGKTSTIVALPSALEALGVSEAHVFRIHCGELTDSIHVTRLLGSPPRYSGHAKTTPLLNALDRPGCILLLDEIDRAHPEVHDLLLGLLDAGRVTAPDGRAIDARHLVVAMTTSVSSDRLEERLEQTPLENRWAVRSACVENLRAEGMPADLLGRIGAFAFYRRVDDEETRTALTRAAVMALADEYGLIVDEIDPIVLEVIDDIARDGGGFDARSLQHAARELLAERFADLAGDGVRATLAIEAGPPLTVRAATRTRRGR